MDSPLSHALVIARNHFVSGDLRGLRCYETLAAPIEDKRFATPSLGDSKRLLLQVRLSAVGLPINDAKMLGVSTVPLPMMKLCIVARAIIRMQQIMKGGDGFNYSILLFINGSGPENLNWVGKPTTYQLDLLIVVVTPMNQEHLPLTMDISFVDALW